jgi:biopolymer transport protein ExbD
MAIKMKKKAGSTDMTAMCDVAFLLLSFFVMTAAKIPEALPVDTPASQFSLNYQMII